MELSSYTLTLIKQDGRLDMGCGIRGAVVFICVGSVVGLSAGETSRRQWKLSEFTWVKRLAAEVGAPVNEHPVKVQIDALRQQLRSVQFTVGTNREPLFTNDELTPLLEPLREALSLAIPGEDLLLLSTHRRGGSFLNTPYGVTARFFVQGGSLNLIVHDARLDFVDRYRATQVLPEFHFGSRTVAGTEVLTSPSATSRRSDWLAFPIEPLTVAPGASPALLKPTAGVAVPVAPSVSTPKVRDAAFFEEQERRLVVLKHLRDEKLITEEDYQQKCKEVLKGI